MNILYLITTLYSLSIGRASIKYINFVLWNYSLKQTQSNLEEWQHGGNYQHSQQSHKGKACFCQISSRFCPESNFQKCLKTVKVDKMMWIVLVFLTLWDWISYRGKRKYIRWSEEQYTLLWCLHIRQYFYFKWDWLYRESFQLVPKICNHYSFTQSHWSIFWVKSIQNNAISYISKAFSSAKNIYSPNI